MGSRAASRKWRANNLEKARKSNREHMARKRATNPEKARADWRAWRATKPREIDRRKHLKRTYDISLEEYDLRLAGQKGVCAICGKPETIVIRGRRAELAVDHPKGTKQVRGLVCQRHNTGMGLFGHNSQLLRAAADYLDRAARRLGRK